MTSDLMTSDPHMHAHACAYSQHRHTHTRVHVMSIVFGLGYTHSYPWPPETWLVEEELDYQAECLEHSRKGDYRTPVPSSGWVAKISA